jgi:gluconolactonase
MKQWAWLSCLLTCVFCGSVFGQEENYPEHPDSVAKPDVPHGEVLGPFDWQSQIFPGTTRKYWLYVPKQYDATKPACVFIVQDGIGRANEWRLPTVMDNLIADGSMPITIGIFIEPGIVPAPNDKSQARYNRSYEYDGLGDRYARFLIEEILPEVGKKYSLSQDPNDRAIGGASSGAICAFTAAWERPDQFRRVLSTIGTYVGLRGGDIYPTLVRKCEPKPLRVFLQDGDHDLNVYAGDWWTANLDMLSALKYAGYEVNHIWGQGGHNGKQGAAIMPDALRWLWKDYPKPIQAGTPNKPRIDIMLPGQNWELVSQGHKFMDAPAEGPDGTVYFADVAENKIFRVTASGKVATFVNDSGGTSGLMMGPDGKLYGCQYTNKQIVRFDAQGKMEVLVTDAPCNDLVVLTHGLYYTDPANHKIWYVTFDGKRKETACEAGYANGLTCSADQTLLHVADSHGIFTYSYQIQSDGSLLHGQTYGYLHSQDGTSRSGADGMKVDTNGNYYVATNLGVQVLDQLGRVNLILSKPSPTSPSNLVFGGVNRDTMYITCGDRVFRRKLNVKGVATWEPAIMPPKPGL